MFSCVFFSGFYFGFLYSPTLGSVFDVAIFQESFLNPFAFNFCYSNIENNVSFKCGGGN